MPQRRGRTAISDGLLLLGAPGSGKSTLASLAATALGLPRLELDDYLFDDASRHDIEDRSFSDDQIDHAAEALLRDVAGRPVICELAHHDNVVLQRFVQSFHGGDDAARRRPLVLSADESTCLLRNSRRRLPVPAAYVTRCVAAIDALLQDLAPTAVRMADSTKQTADEILRTCVLDSALEHPPPGRTHRPEAGSTWSDRD